MLPIHPPLQHAESPTPCVRIEAERVAGESSHGPGKTSHPNLSIGILLCGCGPNFTVAIDLKKLRSELVSRQNVKWVAKRNLACSDGERKEVVRLLRTCPVDRVVVAGRSPKEQETTLWQVLSRLPSDIKQQRPKTGAIPDTKSEFERALGTFPPVARGIVPRFTIIRNERGHPRD